MNLKKNFNMQYFDVTAKDDTLIFKLNNSIPFSKASLIIKHHETGKRILKKINKSKVTVNFSEILSIGEIGVFDVYLQTRISNKLFLKRTPFKKENKNKMILDKNNEFIFKSVEKDSSLSFELRHNYDDSLLDITKVYGEDISEITYNKPDSLETFEYNLSAIVLVYNGGDYLRDCIASLVNQTIEGLEIILINDKSTDDSLDICKEFAMQYDNIRIIDKQENHGLATSANMGIKIAKGEYITLVDNDDIVPLDAYEKLYEQAKKVNADISIGQPNLLYGNSLREMHDVERKVLEEERVIDNICEFPSLFNDAFYWNKIIRKSLLVDNEIYLPKGMIYADRKFCHMAFIHAEKISVIPDCVYIWRMRTEENDMSLSSRKREAWNYINRIESYELELDKIIAVYPDYFKILMRRVIIPVKGILKSDEFEKVFFDKGVGFLKRECGKLEDIYDNMFDNWDNIILYLLLNDHTHELKRFLKLHVNNERKITDRNDRSYWNIFLFDKDIVPNELLEIRSMMPQFLNIGKISVNDNHILFDDITLPKHLKTKRCEINFVGITDCNAILKDNTLSYDIVAKDLDENVFYLKVPTSDLSSFEAYDIFFKSFYEDRLSDSFRIKRESIHDIEEYSENIFVAITEENFLSIISQNLDSAFKIEADEEFIKFTLLNHESFKQKINLFIQNDLSNERTYFSLADENEYSIEWKYFSDENSKYSFYISGFDNRANNKNIKLNLRHMSEFGEINLIDKAIILDNKNNLKLLNN